jgi:hypothetical protein
VSADDTIKVQVRAQAWSNISFDRKGEIDTGVYPEEWEDMPNVDRVSLVEELAREWLLEDISIDYELPEVSR